MNENQEHSKQIRKHNYAMWLFMGFIAYLLITEHWAHVVPFLPYLILLLCPLIHYFMHGSPGSGHDHHSRDKEE